MIRGLVAYPRIQPQVVTERSNGSKSRSSKAGGRGDRAFFTFTVASVDDALRALTISKQGILRACTNMRCDARPETAGHG